MKLDAIVKNTPKLRRQNARLVKVVSYRAGRDHEGYAVAMAKTYSPRELTFLNRLIRARDQNKYVTHIKFLDKQLNVHVSCSCPDFMFTWEAALAAQKAAEIRYSTGDMPDTRNPRYVAGCCKHIVALRNLVKAKHGI